jgi:hypothetical protein
VIPAENLVAAFQPGPGQLLGVAHTAADARVMLEALEAGTAGVLLRTEDPLEVRTGAVRDIMCGSAEKLVASVLGPRRQQVTCMDGARCRRARMGCGAAASTRQRCIFGCSVCMGRRHSLHQAFGAVTKARKHTACPQVKALSSYLQQREAEGAPSLKYQQATVTR